MIFHGFELMEEWRNSHCGQIVSAMRGGKKYFLKKYQTPVMPINNGTLDAKTFMHNKKQFEDFVITRSKINNTISSVTGAGGNIVVACEQFIEGNQYVEASEFIEGAIDEDEIEGVLSGLSVDVKKLLMQTAAGALDTIHKKNIVHSDLKLQNVLLVRNHTGNYVAKLIDFESSYFVNEKPDEIIGTIDYYSPELGAYADAEDDREEMGKLVTQKSDIFSLGLIFHFYLAGELPEPVNLTERLEKRREKGKVIYCWIALNSGCQLKLSPKINSHKYASLISDMLKKNPDDRPTAEEVLRRLKQAEPAFEEPWPEHSIIIDKEKMKGDGIQGIRKINTGSEKIYELCYVSGEKESATAQELDKKGYVKSNAPKGFCKPWAEHNIIFDRERIASRGFIASEQAEVSGIKGYKLYRPDSNSVFFKLETLMAMKYACEKKAEDSKNSKDFKDPKDTKTVKPVKKVPVVRRATVTVAKPVARAVPSTSAEPSKEAVPSAEAMSSPYTFCEPWPEHRIKFNRDKIIDRGYVRTEQTVLGGIKGYSFFGIDGSSRFIRREMLIIQKLADNL